MDSAQSRSLRKMVTRCREILEKSVFELLEGKYGIHRGGTVEDAGRLIYLTDEDRRGREEIVASLGHLKSFGLDARAAVERLVREVAFTHLNRLCALKMIEQRGLIREAVGRGHDSRGFKYYLAEHPEEEAAWLAGEQDLVYRRFLQSSAGALEEEIGSLFSRNDPARTLFPPPRALKEVLEQINDPDLNEVWRQDETIGWVYQLELPRFGGHRQALVFRLQ
ncbi:MAG: BREX-1 system adenine-specific DNA-methyltransferase PglX, partial [Firmicutes bacterium]|nr:BREX-1 system adenine-specific DNA-methyltransferase PglX [Bacillota bacterium]